MPFDPSKPAEHSDLSSQVMRGQLNALKALIDAVPAGPPFAGALVDSVATLNPGESATVSVSFDGTNVRFSVGIPRGADGAAGEVSLRDLAAAIAVALIQTPRNPSGITSFSGTFSDPPTQGEMNAFAAYVESLRLDLLRAP